MLTIPFWSPHYLIHRKTALLPLGDLNVLREVVQHYQADYILFQWYWPGDQPPRLPFLIPLIRGQRHILFHINRHHPALLNPNISLPHLADFDLVGYFWKDRFSFQTDIPLYKALINLLQNKLLGLSLFAIIWIIVLLSQYPLRRWLSILLLILIIIAAIIVQVVALRREVAPLQITPPHFCLTQAHRFVASSSKPPQLIRLDLENAALINEWKRDWKKIGMNVLLEPYAPGRPPTPGEAVFIEVVSSLQTPGRSWNADDSFYLEGIHNQHLKQAAEKLTRDGYRVEILDAGVIGLPAEPIAMTPQ